MSAPSDPAPADPLVWHYDGISALRRRARLEPRGDTFVLIENGRLTGPFPFADLTATEGGYGLKGHPGWRIAFDTPLPAALPLPDSARYGRLVDRFGFWRSTAAFAVIAAIAVMVALRTPALVARMVPASVERRMGELMVGDFGRRGCSTPAGDAALAALVRRVDPAARDLEVHVVKLPLVNAVTLPGGRIVFFDGLIRAARSPDEVAGVLGHEIGHVRHRDTMESLLRQLGLSVLLGGMEGHVGGYTNAVLASTYSRDAETRADGYAIALLADAAVSPVATADFFRRLGGRAERSERMLAYLSSHPVSADRARRFRAAAASGSHYRPALGPSEWRALRSICAGEDSETRWRF